MIYRSSLASFAMENELTNALYFGSPLLPLIDTFVISMWLNLMYKIVLGLRINYYDSKIETIVLWETFQSCFLFDRNKPLLPFFDIFRFDVTQLDVLFCSDSEDEIW